MKNKVLWIIFILLLAAFIGTKLFDKKPQRSFKSDFMEIVSDEITKINVHPKEGQGEVFTLTKVNDSWIVTDGAITAPAMTEAVESLLKTTTDMRAKRVVSKDKEKWPDYEVDEVKGKKLEFFKGDKKVEELVLGRFDFNQQARTAKSYVRHLDDVNVYVVDGFLSMTMAQSMDAFRDKTLIDLDQNTITHIDYSYGASNKSLRKENYWVDDSNQTVDSLRMNSYLSVLSKLSGTQFVDNLIPSLGVEVGSIVIKTSSRDTPVRITCNHIDHESTPFIIQSTANPGAKFYSDSAGVYKKLFTDFDFVNN